MKVILAGYNLDTDIIDSLAGARPDLPLTPETVSAAYARISRDPRPVDELRAAARMEVDRARRSNKNIIFSMGHHSVAEHAVFNFDIIGLSRLGCEAIEKFRLCSFTEKSQRYITLDRDFLVPAEVIKAGFEKEFTVLVQKQAGLYEKMFEKLKIQVLAANPELAAEAKNENLLEGWAKEDARYISALGTLSQLGMTTNARNLELIFRRLAAADLAEVQELGREMYSRVEKISPSVILFVEPSPLDRDTYPELTKISEKYFGENHVSQGAAVKVVEAIPDGDDRILAALAHRTSGAAYDDCFNKIKKLSRADKEEFFKTAVRHLEFFDAPPREFEFAEVTFSLEISAACFAQLKRHRMASISVQDYDPALGVTIPESVIKAGFENELRKIMRESEDLFNKMKPKIGRAAQYILTNAHRRRVLLKTNIRELYHISRLREDAHAQWDIREISTLMSAAAKKYFPIMLGLIGGKDKYAEIYGSVFGQGPKVIPPAGL